MFSESGGGWDGGERALLLCSSTEARTLSITLLNCLKKLPLLLIFMLAIPFSKLVLGFIVNFDKKSFVCVVLLDFIS